MQAPPSTESGKGEWPRCITCNGKVTKLDCHSECIFCLGSDHFSIQKSQSFCKHCRSLPTKSYTCRFYRVMVFIEFGKRLSEKQAQVCLSALAKTGNPFTTSGLTPVQDITDDKGVFVEESLILTARALPKAGVCAPLPKKADLSLHSIDSENAVVESASQIGSVRTDDQVDTSASQTGSVRTNGQVDASASQTGSVRTDDRVDASASQTGSVRTADQVDASASKTGSVRTADQDTRAPPTGSVRTDVNGNASAPRSGGVHTVAGPAVAFIPDEIVSAPDGSSHPRTRSGKAKVKITKPITRGFVRRKQAAQTHTGSFRLDEEVEPKTPEPGNTVVIPVSTHPSTTVTVHGGRQRWFTDKAHSSSDEDESEGKSDVESDADTNRGSSRESSPEASDRSYYSGSSRQSRESSPVTSFRSRHGSVSPPPKRRRERSLSGSPVHVQARDRVVDFDHASFPLAARLQMQHEASKLELQLRQAKISIELAELDERAAAGVFSTGHGTGPRGGDSGSQSIPRSQTSRVAPPAPQKVLKTVTPAKAVCDTVEAPPPLTMASAQRRVTSSISRPSHLTVTLTPQVVEADPIIDEGSESDVSDTEDEPLPEYVRQFAVETSHFTPKEQVFPPNAAHCQFQSKQALWNALQQGASFPNLPEMMAALDHPQPMPGGSESAGPHPVRVLDTDLGMTSLESIRKKVDFIQGSVLERMSTLGLWSNPPQPEVHDHSLSFQPEGKVDSTAPPGLPVPAMLARQILEIWGNPKASKRGRAGQLPRLWSSHFQTFLMLPSHPSEEELSIFQIDRTEFERRLKTQGWSESTKRAQGQLVEHSRALRVHLNSAAWVQFNTTNARRSFNALSKCVRTLNSQESVPQEVLEHIRTTIVDQEELLLAAWCQYVMAFSGVDLAARAIAVQIKQLRTDAMYAIYGNKCPPTIMDKALARPIYHEAFFGGDPASLCSDIAAKNATLTLASHAAVQMGGQPLVKEVRQRSNYLPPAKKARTTFSSGPGGGQQPHSGTSAPSKGKTPRRRYKRKQYNKQGSFRPSGEDKKQKGGQGKPYKPATEGKKGFNGRRGKGKGRGGK